MLVNLLFLIAISSGSALAAVLWDKEYEDILPVTVSGIIMIQFFMGLIGFLEVGFILVSGSSVLIWLTVFYILFKKRDIKKAIKPFFSHGFWLFLILYVGFNYVLYGMKAHEGDEFSHWATVVKAMVQTGGLGTSPQAHLRYGSYPPGMALFQFFLQKICLAFGKKSFSEWRLYLAYNVLLISFVLPLVKRIGARSFRQKLLVALVIFLAPVSFYRDCYHVLLIDAVLGILLGAGLAMVVTARDKSDALCFFYFLSLCAILPLMKVSGILLAVCIALAYMADYRWQTTASRRELVKHAGALALAIGIPELLWHIHVKLSGVRQATSVTFRFSDLYHILTGKDDTYRGTVFRLFKTALFNNTAIEGNTNFSVGDLGVSISYFSLLVIFTLAVYFSWHTSKKVNRLGANSIIVAFSAAMFSWLCFYIGLGITYLFKFSEEEALRLASYSRYTHVIYLGMYMLSLAAVLSAVLRRYSGGIIGVVILGASLLLTPMENVAKLIFRDTVQESIAEREPYVALSKKICNVTKPYDNIFFLCQDERHWVSAAAYWQTSFEIRPAVIDHVEEGWVLAPESTGWYISDLSPTEWQQLLLDEYDYVALYMLDDYFYDAFSGLFADPADIGENNVYRINKESGLLELCE